MLICGISSIAAFAVVFAVVNSNLIYNSDVSVFRLINSTLNVPSLNGFFAMISLYGREYFWIPVVILMWVFGKAKEKKAALILVVVFIILIIVGLLLKQVYFRPRPFMTLSGITPLVPIDTDSSFPSGHALIVAGGAVIALLFLKKRYSIPLLIEAALVCYSRVYVGVHYPTDVLAGIFLGAGIALLTAYLLVDSAVFQRVFSEISGVYNRIVHAKHV